jgi:hypothetical protein
MSFPEWTSVLGNLGDFISSIAVLLTLIYLTIQVKQAKHEVSLIGRQARATHAVSVLAPIVTSSELPRIFAKLNLVDYGDFGLTAEESVRFGAWFHTWLQTEQGSFYLLPAGDNDPLLTWMLATPAGAEFWEKNKGIYDSPFVEHVEGLRRRLESAPKTGEDVLAGKQSSDTTA